MKRVLISLCVAAASCAPSLASAAIPSCGDKLIQPAPGTVLSPEALDSNNACLSFLQAAAQAARLKAEIADADRKAKGETRKVDPQARDMGNAAARMPALPPLPSIGAGAQAQNDGGTDSLPLVDWGYVDASTAHAVLLFENGGSLDATRGTPLPNGWVVERISAHGDVDVKKNERIVRLQSGSFSSASRAPEPSLQPRLILPNPSVPLIPMPPTVAGGR